MARPASNRTVKALDIVQSIPGEERIPVWYKNYTDKEAYIIWKELEVASGRKPCSESTFRKIVRSIPNLKKSRKQTDKCGICFEGLKCQRKLQNLLKRRKRLRTFAEADEIRKLKGFLALFSRHKSDVEHQHMALKLQKASLKYGEVLIHLDFKSNIILNEDAEIITSKEFYQNCQRTLFGAVVYFIDEDDLKCVFFDIFSDFTCHNSYFVGQAIEKIFQHDFFKSKNFHSAKFWLDNGPNHFKTKETFGSLFTIPNKFPNITNVEWNFFVEYHGKNVCDVRFSVIKSMLDQHNNNPTNERLTTLEQVCEVVGNTQERYNKRREEKIRAEEKRGKKGKRKPLSPIKSYQLILQIDEMPQERLSLNIENFTIYYSFKRINGTLVASILTGGPVVQIWNDKDLVVMKKFKPKKGAV
jgi:hypothetical protein